MTGGSPAQDTVFGGVFPAVVTDLADPDHQGRVKVRLPWTPDGSSTTELWARLAVFMAGGNRGAWFLPEVDDEVLVAFEAGNPNRPYVLGALWNGQDAPPESATNQNDIRSLTSRAGSKFTMDDTSGAVVVRISTPNGQQLELSDAGGGSVELRDASGNSVRMGTSGLTVTGASSVTVRAPSVSVSTSSLSVSSPLSTFSGVVQADVVISNSIVSAAYTPGAGNIL